jgi:hypothetical protein
VDPLKCGQLLGELTNELSEFSSPDDPPDAPAPYISSFASSGPKSYCYQVTVPAKNEIKEVRKIKGFTLNYQNKDIMGMEPLRKMITGEVPEYEVEQMNKIGRNNLFEVYTEHGSKKKMRLVFTKRRRIGVDRSVPFGTVDDAVELDRPIPKDEFDVRDWRA